MVGNSYLAKINPQKWGFFIPPLPSSDITNISHIYHRIIAESRQLPHQVHARVHAPRSRAHGRDRADVLVAQCVGLYYV
ncbi:hypothetical protein KA057_03435 [Candidatus Gracilibacteria bacterium]|nr:hypothetical protein [Candidatus Gracilibacteria bacterium]